MCLVLEWVAKGPLRDFLETPDLRWDDPLLRFACDIARGMNYLHNRKYFDEVQKEQKQCILHRDLKPDNVLVTDFIAGKIADFGTSRSKAADDVTMTAVGTPLYVAPEIVRGEKYDEKVDVYSFGLTLTEMSVDNIFDFIGKRWKTHFKKKKIPKQTTRMIRPMTEDGWRPITKDNPIPYAPPGVNDLIIRCCAHDPKDRPSFQEILDEFNGKVKVQVDRNVFGRKSFIIPINHRNDNDDNDDNILNHDVSENMRYTSALDDDDEEEEASNGRKSRWVRNPSLKGDELIHRLSAPSQDRLGQATPMQEQELMQSFNLIATNTYV
jgi:serine/threonine protein kinase